MEAQANKTNWHGAGYLTLLAFMLFAAGMILITVQSTWFTFELKKAVIGFVGCFFGFFTCLVLTEWVWDNSPKHLRVLFYLSLLISIGCCFGLFWVVLSITSMGAKLIECWPGLVGFTVIAWSGFALTEVMAEDLKNAESITGVTALFVGLINGGNFFFWWGNYTFFDKQMTDEIVWTATLGFGVPMIAGVGAGTLILKYKSDSVYNSDTV